MRYIDIIVKWINLKGNTLKYFGLKCFLKERRIYHIHFIKRIFRQILLYLIWKLMSVHSFRSVVIIFLLFILTIILGWFLCYVIRAKRSLRARQRNLRSVRRRPIASADFPEIISQRREKDFTDPQPGQKANQPARSRLQLLVIIFYTLD